MAQPDRIINFVERARVRTCTAMLSNKKDPNSEFGLLENKIPALQGCGVVFLACRNTILGCWRNSALREGFGSLVL
jgi:hypothetical protein